MNSAGILNPNEGNRPQHPEVAEDMEAAMPASEQSKHNLLDTIDGQLERISASEDIDTGEIRKGRTLYDASGNPVNIFRYLGGRDDGRVADVMYSVRGEGGGSDMIRYEISKIPDGLSIEKFFHFSGDLDLTDGLAKLRPKLLRNPEVTVEVIDDLLESTDSILSSQKKERELGLTFASKKNIEAITKIIQEAQPHEGEEEDKKFLRQERQAKSREGKTEEDGAGRAPDIPEAEFIAHAMDSDMTEVARMASSASFNEEMVARLEAQAEGKASKAKAAYELGVRSLAEVFGKDSREGMAEQGWRYLTNISAHPAQNDFEFGGDEAYLSQLRGRFGENVTTKPAYSFSDKPVRGMIGVFVKQDAWENDQKALSRD